MHLLKIQHHAWADCEQTHPCHARVYQPKHMGQMHSQHQQTKPYSFRHHSITQQTDPCGSTLHPRARPPCTAHLATRGPPCAARTAPPDYPAAWPGSAHSPGHWWAQPSACGDPPLAKGCEHDQPAQEVKPMQTCGYIHARGTTDREVKSYIWVCWHSTCC